MEEKHLVQVVALVAAFAIGYHLGAKRAAAAKAAASQASPWDTADYLMSGIGNWNK